MTNISQLKQQLRDLSYHGVANDILITTSQIEESKDGLSDNLQEETYRLSARVRQTTHPVTTDSIRQRVGFDPTDFGMVVAGGFISSLYHDTKVNDFDLFPIIRDNTEILQQVAHLIDHLQPVKVYRNSYAFTLVGESNVYQVILRKHSSIAEILLSFDLPISQCAWDGRQIYLTPAAQFCLQYNVFFIDQARFRNAAAFRVQKYIDRGYDLLLERTEITKQNSGIISFSQSGVEHQYQNTHDNLYRLQQIIQTSGDRSEGHYDTPSQDGHYETIVSTPVTDPSIPGHQRYILLSDFTMEGLQTVKNEYDDVPPIAFFETDSTERMFLPMNGIQVKSVFQIYHGTELAIVMTKREKDSSGESSGNERPTVSDVVTADPANSSSSICLVM